MENYASSRDIILNSLWIRSWALRTDGEWRRCVYTHRKQCAQMNRHDTTWQDTVSCPPLPIFNIVHCKVITSSMNSLIIICIYLTNK